MDSATTTYSVHMYDPRLPRETGYMGCYWETTHPSTNWDTYADASEAAVRANVRHGAVTVIRPNPAD